MNGKTILIIEDREKQRQALQDALELRGFQVYSAGNVCDARSLMNAYQDVLDVMILDMRLEDPAHPEITGADLGLEVSKKRPVWPPEFLIQSAYSNVSYYELALRLRVAAYLNKETNNQQQVIRHVRALALRRSLSVERPDLARRIELIGETSRTQHEAVKQFCRQVLIPELTACLGSPFLLLLQDRGRTIACGGNAGTPAEADPAYELVQTLAIRESRAAGYFLFHAEKTPPLTIDREDPILKRLDGGAFIPLCTSEAFPLTLGILKADSGEFPLAENPGDMAQALTSYLKPAVLDQFLKLSSIWAENNARRDARLTETSRIFLYLGQEQLSILQDARESGEWTAKSKNFQKLQALAEDLSHTGEMLSSLRIKPGETAHCEEIGGLARSVWKEIGSPNIQSALSVSGRCAVQASAEDLFIILSRLFQWFAERFSEYPPNVKTEVTIHCEASETGPMIVLEDRSRRLPETLRKRLFDVFTFTGESNPNLPGLYLPLYLAKALVEEKYNGRIEECSDQIGGDLGHRFILQFQPFEQAVARGAC